MESIDTQTASGRMFLKIIGIFAEFERENIIERVKLGRERKVKEGYTLCSSHASYGYDRGNGQKIQSVNEDEAQIVREIFDMYVNQNMPLNNIARVLNLRKIPTKKNTVWQRKNIKNILKNSNYIGRVRHFIGEEKYTENDGLHEAIISEELFDQAQRIISATPSLTATKKPKDCNYYLGLLFCGKCGKKMTTHGRYKTLTDGSKQYYGSYRCGDSDVGCCSCGEMNHNKIEAAFRGYITLVSDFKVADKISLEQSEKIHSDNQALIDEYNGKLAEFSAKEKEILSLYVDDEIDFDSYKQMRQKISHDRDIINAELDKLSVPADEDAPLKKEDIILNLSENWDLLTDLEKRRFLMRFVKRIVVTSEKSKNTRTNTVRIENVEFNTA